MTGQRAGALPSVKGICALIFMVASQYVLLDTDLAKLLNLDVSTLKDRMWLQLATLCQDKPSEWYVLELGNGRDGLGNGPDEPLAYTLLGVIVALTVVSDKGPNTRAFAVIRRIVQAFVRKKRKK